MAKRSILVGSVDQTIDVFIQDSSSTVGAGLTALVYNSAGLTCYYRKGATGSATALTLATQTVGGAHSDGGFILIDNTNMPGVYRLDLSDTIVNTAGMVTIYLRGATNMAPCVAEIEVVDFAMMGQSAIDLKDFADAGYDPATNKVQGVVLTDTVTTLTNLPAITANWLTAAGTAADFTTEIQAGLATAAALDVVDNFLDTEIADIQARLPAALTAAGNMKSDALALNGSTAAAAMLAILNGANVVYSGTVTGAATTTTLIDSGLTQADTDWWKGRIIIFTSVITGQATDITAFDPALDKLTFTATTAAPTGATYVII